MKSVLAFAVAITLAAAPFAGALAQQTQPGTSSPQPPSSAAGTGSSQVGGGQSQLTVASDSLLGTTVRDSQGKDIGEVSKLMIDASGGQVTSVIIRQGGTLGMGGKEISVPWDALQLQRGQDQKLIVTMQQELLQQAPTGQEQRPAPSASPPTSPQEQQPTGERR